jgi:riboflavin kinase/FMN adenylyltransferase
MQILEGITDVPERCRGAVLAIGNFDGVHRGHQAILGAAMTSARTARAAAGVMVFEPHPRQYFQPKRPLFRLTPLSMKLRLLEAMGLDYAVVMPFDAALAALPAATFVETVLAGALAVRHVVIGYDFFFGNGRHGSPEIMRAMGERHGFGVTVVPPVGASGAAYSSTGVRELLAEGHVRDAAEMLGHWWRISGTVVGGHQIGTGLGFPTANIHLAAGIQLHHGIYAVRIHHAGRRYKGAAYLGTRPTLDDGPPVLEVFLFDFDGNLYGETIEVEFIAFQRRDVKFRSLEELKLQMDKDCSEAAALLAAVERDDPMRAYPIGRALAESMSS